MVLTSAARYSWSQEERQCREPNKVSWIWRIGTIVSANGAVAADTAWRSSGGAKVFRNGAISAWELATPLVLFGVSNPNRGTTYSSKSVQRVLQRHSPLNRCIGSCPLNEWEKWPEIHSVPLQLVYSWSLVSSLLLYIPDCNAQASKNETVK